MGKCNIFCLICCLSWMRSNMVRQMEQKWIMNTLANEWKEQQKSATSCCCLESKFMDFFLLISISDCSTFLLFCSGCCCQSFFRSFICYSLLISVHLSPHVWTHCSRLINRHANIWCKIASIASFSFFQLYVIIAISVKIMIYMFFVSCVYNKKLFNK